MAQEEWRLYEEQIYERLKELGGPQAEVEFDAKLPGQLSGVERQVDVLVKGRFAGDIEHNITAAVDAKCFKRNVHVKDVEAFIGLVEDVQTDLGILITTEGFSPGAKSRARRSIRLHVVPRVALVMWDEFHSFPDVEAEEPEEPEHYYGDSFDHEPYGASGLRIGFSGPDEWTVLAADNDVGWGDDESNRVCAEVILRHYLRREPDEDEVDGFLGEFEDTFTDGYPWELTLADIGVWVSRPPPGEDEF